MTVVFDWMLFVFLGVPRVSGASLWTRIGVGSVRRHVAYLAQAVEEDRLSDVSLRGAIFVLLDARNVLEKKGVEFRHLEVESSKFQAILGLFEATALNSFEYSRLGIGLSREDITELFADLRQLSK